jgi:elongation factor Ts
MGVDAKSVAKLRADTGAGMMECKKALKECDGDFEKAKDYLRKRGVDVASKKAGRSTENGWIGSYVHHNGRIGVMVELNCETDFVAKGEVFQGLLKDIAMHIAMTNPLAIKKEDVPEQLVAKEREIYEAQVPPGKPPEVVAKIVDGKLNSFFKERCLLEQGFIKDPKVTIRDHITAVIQKTGENIAVGRFSRFELGQNQ